MVKESRRRQEVKKKTEASMKAFAVGTHWVPLSADEDTVKEPENAFLKILMLQLLMRSMQNMFLRSSAS